MRWLFSGLLCTGEERAFGKFLFSYAVDSPVHIPPEQATILDSTFWACFTAGRGLATLASFFVQPLPVIGFCMVVNISSSIILAVFGSVYPLATWIGAGVFGASMSPLFPVAMAWMNSIVGFSSTAASVSFIANAMGAFLYSWLAGEKIFLCKTMHLSIRHIISTYMYDLVTGKLDHPYLHII